MALAVRMVKDSGDAGACDALCMFKSGSSIKEDSWRTSPLTAPCKEPGTCCLSCTCPCCTACQQRQEILRLANLDYVCCGGLFADWGCCLFGRCGRSCPILEEPFPLPILGVLLEAFCCTPFAIIGNRKLIQDEFHRASDEWDDCICCCFAASQMAQHADELRLIHRQYAPEARTYCTASLP
mmetsp:Transcript_118346/g.280927  ORF Transcript_118346/g.280927 Transcript_118346/m.280927 type:complete len:182 (-) Transcript_118346:36-581(-)